MDSSANQRPFKMLLLGNFSGDDQSQAVADRKIVEINRDNFSQVMSQFEVRLSNVQIDANRQLGDMEFSHLDDFHPDELFERLSAFEELKQLRNQLLDDSTFEAASREIRSWGGGNENAEPQQRTSDAIPSGPAHLEEELSGEDVHSEDNMHSEDIEIPDGASVLDVILDAEQGESNGNNAAAPAVSPWQRMIDELVTPHLHDAASPKQAQLTKIVDAAVTATMQSLLHHSTFRELETNWRLVHFLTRRVETCEDLKIFLLNVNKEELQMEMLDGELEKQALYHQIVTSSVETPGADPWTLVVNLADVDLEQDSIAVLEQLAKLVKAAGATLLATAGDRLIGDDAVKKIESHSLSELAIESNRQWKEFRARPESQSTGLVWPHFLLRLPYGVESNPVESFEFEELSKTDADELLWGSGAVLVAERLADAFSRRGWQMNLGDPMSVDNLPLFIREIHSTTEVQPPTRVLLTDGIAELLQNHGVFCLRSIRNSDRVLLGTPVAVNGKQLLGSWND